MIFKKSSILDVWQNSKYALGFISIYASILIIAKILNMQLLYMCVKFYIWQAVEYSTILKMQGCEHFTVT